jgi:hypothetical protein
MSYKRKDRSVQVQGVKNELQEERQISSIQVQGGKNELQEERQISSSPGCKECATRGKTDQFKYRV